MIASDNFGEVNGPVAIMHSASSGIPWISSRRILIFGCSANARVTLQANWSLSTANAVPAGIRTSSATRMIKECNCRISSFNIPGALRGSFDPKEFEQTISARCSVLCAAVSSLGRISYRVTLAPALAACQAASDPARPPPIITRSVLMIV